MIELSAKIQIIGFPKIKQLFFEPLIFPVFIMNLSDVLKRQDMNGRLLMQSVVQIIINLLKFITKMSEPFPVEQFRDVFQVTSKIKNKLQPFLAQYKALNMEWIVNSLEELHRYFFEDRNDINLKFNSIFGIKFLFDTAEVVLVNLIEIYFLPKILEIASFDARGNEEKRGTGYFVSVGYAPNTSEIDKFSYNFVRLASEFIQAAAVVKPKRLYLSDEIEEPSDFYEACQRLQEQGWKPYAKPAYYKETAPAIAAQFKKNLQAFEGVFDTYIDFYNDIFKAYLQNGKTYQGRLNPKKVMEAGDPYVTGPVIELCSDAFRSRTLRNRMQALGLLNEFVRWGDVEAAYHINCTDLLDDVLHQIANTSSGIVSLSRGKSMFSKLETSQQQKQEFYIEVLKSIQLWSLCFPRAIKVKNKDSKIKQAHDQLRMKLKIEFPQDKNLKEHKMQFDRNYAKKRIRNKLLLEQLENSDPEYVSIVPILKGSQKKIESQKETPQAPIARDYERIKASIIDASNCLDTLLSNQTAASQKAQKLLNFRNDFEKGVESAEVSDDEFNQLIETGSPLVERIEKILPHLNNHAAKKTTFAEFAAAINPKPLTGRSQTQKEVKQITSKVKIEGPLMSEKQIKLDEVSLKVEEKSLNSVDKSSLKPIATQKNHTEVLVDPQTLKTMTLVDRMEKDMSKIFEEVRKSNTQEIKLKEEIRSKEDVKVSHVEKKSLAAESKKTDPQITPIKRMQEEEEKFSEERSMGSLPQISKQSFTKSFDKSLKNQEELNIEPASHQIIQKKETVNISLFKEKEKHQASIHQKEETLPNFSKKKIQDAEELEEDEIQNFVEVKAPKIIDNVKGSYRLKGEGSAHIIRDSKNQQQSRISSRQGSRIDFEESKISKVEAPIQDEDDLIVMPDISPLDVSYHDIGGFEDQIKGNKELSFKKCFEADKYLLGSDKNTKMFWLEKQTMSLIKSGSVRRTSRNKESTISIPEILSEKDKKYQEQLRYIEEQKNRRIRELQNKINNLQTEGKQLQQKIVEQNQQIMTYKAQSSVSNSRAKKNFYLEDQDQLFRTRHAQKNGRDKDRSFYNQPQIRESKCLQPQGKLINSRKYADYFASFTEEKRKKNLLKNKELLFKDESIEFGCMSKREGQTLVITFYITPESDIEELTYNIDPVAYASLKISVEPRHIPSIRRKKQEKVVVSVIISEIPYHLPDIEFVYNLNSKLSSHKFTIPCAFHKFVRIDPSPEKEVINRFQTSKTVIRGEEVPYSRKILKNVEMLAEYFPHGTLIRDGEPNENGQIEFGGRAEWGREKFWLRILIKPSQFLCVQAAGESLSSTVEFYISVVTSLLMKNVELSELK